MAYGFSFRLPALSGRPMTVRDARTPPFRLFGLYSPETPGLFRRMPETVASRVNKNVCLLHTNPAGARLRFTTDSVCIAIGAEYPPMEFPSPRTAAFCAAGAFSFDLYVDGKFLRTLWPEDVLQESSVVRFSIRENQYEAAHFFPEKKLRQITLHFPSFVNIRNVYIGLDPDAVLQPCTPYRNENPVVVYGSSITQGACASHPGNIYTNLLSRWLNIDILNLGFASGAAAEPEILSYLCSLKTPMLIFDYDHNAPSPEYLEQSHLPALRTLRSAHPDIPFLVLSKPNQHNGQKEALQRAEIIENSVRILQAENPAPVHFIHGQEIFSRYDQEMMVVDGTHPTDFGFFCMAEAIAEVMRQYFP